MKSDLIDLALIYQTETPLAACFHEEESGPLFGGAAKPRDVWLPLSRIEIEGDRKRGAVVTVTLPERLAIEKGLV